VAFYFQPLLLCSRESLVIVIAMCLSAVHFSSSISIPALGSIHLQINLGDRGHIDGQSASHPVSQQSSQLDMANDRQLVLLCRALSHVL